MWKTFTENVSYMRRGILQAYDSKISRLSASFMVTWTQLKFKNH